MEENRANSVRMYFAEGNEIVLRQFPEVYFDASKDGARRLHVCRLSVGDGEDALLSSTPEIDENHRGSSYEISSTNYYCIDESGLSYVSPKETVDGEVTEEGETIAEHCIRTMTVPVYIITTSSYYQDGAVYSHEMTIFVLDEELRSQLKRMFVKK